MRSLVRSFSIASVVGLTSGVFIGNRAFAKESVNVEEPSEQVEAPLGDADKKKVKRTRKIRKRISRNKKLPNPGFYDAAINDARNSTYIDIHEGARGSLTAGLVMQPKKQFICELNSSMSPPHPQTRATTSCTFDAKLSLPGGQQYLTALNFQDGSVGGRIHHPLSKNLTFSSQFQLHSKRNSVASNLEYKGSDWCGAFQFSPAEGSGLNYLQSIHPKVALGANLLHLPGVGTAFSALAKYKNTTKSPLTFTASVSSQLAFNMTCLKQVTPAVSVASAYNLQPSQLGNLESSASVTVRYQYFTFNYSGKVESDGKMSMSYEQQLLPALSFNVCGEINQWTDDSKFGIGFRFSPC